MRWRLLILLACVALLARAPDASASWPAGGLLLERPRPAGENGFLGLGADGAGGTYAAWAERDAFGEFAFRVHRLDALGNPPSGWTEAGVRALSPNGFTLTPQLVPDGAGGSYVVWGLTDSTAYVGRIASDGSLAAGWPAGGLPVSNLGKQLNVVATADGAGGVLVAWSRVLNGAPFDIVTQRFLANGTRAPGFPLAGRVITSFDYVRGRFHPQLVRDPGHGFWVSYHGVEIDPSFPASTYAVLHLDTSGSLSAGQPANGVKLSIPYAEIGTLQPYARVPLALDGSGGVFAFTLGGAGAVRAFHVLGTGGEDAAWPAGGVLLTSGAAWPSVHFDDGDENWPVAAGDLAGGAWVGWRNADGLLLYGSRVLANGTIAPGWSVPVLLAGGMQVTFSGDATGLFASALAPVGCPHFDCFGPVVLSRTNLDGSLAPGWPAASPPNVPAPGIAVGTDGFPFWPRLVADGAGGVVLAWSDYPDYFALRFNAAGPLADVPPPHASTLGVRAHFDRSSGVRVWFSTGGGEGVIELFDVVGRRLAAAEVRVNTGDVLLPDTRGLGAGVFFARLTSPSGRAVTRVVAMQ